MKILNSIIKNFSYIVIFMSMVIIGNKMLSLPPFDKIVNCLVDVFFKVLIYVGSKSLELIMGIKLIN